MAKNRIGFGSDFVLTDQQVGIGTTFPTAKLQVVGTIKGDFNVAGVSTLGVYAGFTPQKQTIDVASTIGFSTSGVGTFIQVTESETGYLSLSGEFNSLSEDIIVDEGRIFEVSVDSSVTLGSLESISVQSHFSVPNGGTTARTADPVEGMVRFNDDLNTLEFYNGIEWRQFTVSGASGRGVFCGGEKPYKTTLEYINISTQGNSYNFGDLTSARFAIGRGSSSTRGLFAGGQRESPAPVTSNIDYITIASEGNGILFGDLTAAGRCFSGASSSTRALFGGVNNTAVVNYVEISTLGNAISFGNLNLAIQKGFACSSSTRALFTGAPVNQSSAKIDYFTIASLGNAIEFGDLTTNSLTKTSCSSSTRGIFAGGYITGSVSINSIDYITISTTGNGIEFGDLFIPTSKSTSTSSEIRGIIAKGSNFGVLESMNVIQYITIATTGDSQDFGDLSYGSDTGTALSDSHGGLGGF
jgi:hypothetical protein